uniref:Uncharacterized protein n=1 Tax=Anguilla anguilla TaxID=7936 RepID=A0A0E9UPL0_ANGAN
MKSRYYTLLNCISVLKYRFGPCDPEAPICYSHWPFFGHSWV